MLKTTLKVLAGVYLAYLALVVLILTPAANFLAPRLVDEYLNRELQSDAILFNPFTLAAQVRGVTLREPDGDFFLGLRSGKVDISLRSLLGHGLVLDALEVLGLRVDLRRLPDGSFNFSDMLPAEEAPPEPAEGGATLPAITIQWLGFEADRIDLTDEAREEVFSTYYEHLDLHVRNLTTVHADEHDPYRIDLRSENGGELHWRGDISLPEERGAGELAITGLQLRPSWRFARPWLNFELRHGEINLRGNYTLDWSDAFVARISEGHFELNNLATRPLDPNALPDTALELQQLRISGIGVDSAAQTATVEEILVDGFDAEGWSEGARTSLAEMLTPVTGSGADPNQPVARDPNQPAATPAPSQPAAETGWSASVARLTLQNSGIDWRSEFTDPALLRVAPIEATLEQLHWPFEGSSPLQLALRVNDTAQFGLQGALELASGAGNIGYSLAGLPLAWFNPNLPEPLHATVTGGELGVEGELALADFQPVTVTMNGAVTDFSGRIVDTEESLTSWETLRWDGLSVDVPGRRVELARLLIDDYRGRLHIAADGSVNASNIWREQLNEAQASTGTDTEQPEESEEAPPWQIRIPEIHIAASELDFQDESLPIHFRTIIGDLNGEITGLETTPGEAAAVNINGTVDGYAPVSLSGTAAPFEETPALDLELDFNGVDMATLSPYSGTYAGYAIERGLLTLNLHYSLENERLKGDNKVLIDQLRLGEKIDSDKALDIPLKLGLALLTDANGVIDLQVPVEGNMNSPEFDISGVIVGAFVNLLTKAVTAPFNLLANLVGSEQDLQRMPFPVGGAALTPPTLEKLTQLNEALQQRPQLTLVIMGRLNLEADRNALREAGLREQLLGEGLTAGDIDSRSPAYLDAIEAHYLALGGEDSEEIGFRQRYNRVLDTIDVTDDTLLALAQERASAIKTHLVNESGLPADRAVIDQASQLDPAREVFSGVELDLDG